MFMNDNCHGSKTLNLPGDNVAYFLGLIKSAFICLAVIKLI